MSRGLTQVAWCFVALLCLLCLPEAAGQSAVTVKPDTTSWIGYDGTWSPFTIKVGTPPRWVYLFPSTSTGETWVIGASGCDGTVECQTARGGIFLANESSTFVSEGAFDLGLNPNLGFSGSGYYGLDTLEVADDVDVKSQVVAIVNDTETWTGVLGLGAQGTTFVDTDNLALIASMAGGNGSVIPSLSYGFTAGASYRLKQVPGSLTLGGYDAARFEPNDISFSLDSNQQPVVTLNSIEASNWKGDNVKLFDTADQGLFTVDSSTPFLWLPEAAALRFEQTFGLEYNDTLQLYFYPNQSQPNSTFLSALNDCNFAFTLSDLSGSTQTVKLSLVGQTFSSLSLSFGYPGLSIDATSQPIPYFPIRKAANATQYTIGRMFLQETYLTVDYERNNFSLSQAVFSQDALTSTQIVEIFSPNVTPVPAPPTAQSLSTGALIGIVVGAICLLLIILGTASIVFVRKRRSSGQEPPKSGLLSLLLSSRHGRRLSEPPTAAMTNAAEIQSTEIKELHSNSAGGLRHITTEVKELQSRSLTSELPDTPTRAAALGKGKTIIYGIDHDPSAPVELPLRTSADFSRDDELLPPAYAASPLASPAISSPGGGSNGGGGVSPLMSPSSVSEKAGGGTWLNTDVSSESEGGGTNESLFHRLRPTSRSQLSPSRSRHSPLGERHFESDRSEVTDDERDGEEEEEEDGEEGPTYMLDDSERVRIDLSGSTYSSTQAGNTDESVAPSRSPQPESRRFSWESTL